MTQDREIILDTETTGLSPFQGHRIVEIGAVEMINKIITGKVFHCYINPERDMPEEAYRVHGISSEFLQDKPLFSSIAQDFLDFVGSSKLVIHNASFDIKFLNYELGREKLPSFNLSDAVDTLALARRKFPGARVNLDSLCKRFSIDNSDREYHGALKDAKLLAFVYIELMGGRQTKMILEDNKKDNLENIQASMNVENISLNRKKIVIKPTEKELNDYLEYIEKEKS